MFLYCKVTFQRISQLKCFTKIFDSSKEVILTSGSQPFWHQGQVSWKTIIPWTGGGRDGLGVIQAHYIYCALYFYYYIIIYNEILIQRTITQNQWEPWACFPATRWSHLGGMGDSDPRRVLLLSSLLHNLVLVAVIAENSASQRWDVGNGSRLFSAFVAISGYSALTLIQNAWRFEVVSHILLRPPSFAIWSSGSSSNTDKVDSPGLFTNG